MRWNVFLLPLLCACDAAPQATALDRHAPAPAFEQFVVRILADSTGLFADDHPAVTPLTAELLLMLEDELKDDSARYHFERFSRRYWTEDPHATRTHAYIRRHMNFPLAMAATAHWYADTRIEGLRELQEYRRMRPLVCTTKEGSMKLERQDRAAVQYLLRVLETTPLRISGSENATIHSIYMREVMTTLDLFTGQYHVTKPVDDLRLHRSEAGVRQAITDRRKWLEE